MDFMEHSFMWLAEKKRRPIPSLLRLNGRFNRFWYAIEMMTSMGAGEMWKKRGKKWKWNELKWHDIELRKWELKINEKNNNVYHRTPSNEESFLSWLENIFFSSDLLQGKYLIFFYFKLPMKLLCEERCQNWGCG